jgi:hypothetical protein
VITCWRSLYKPAESITVPDAALFERARNPRSYRAKADVGRWAGAEFRDGYRSTAAFLRACWVVLDFDVASTREAVERAFGDCYGLAHTTWTPGRWRVGLMLSRPVDIQEHERTWRAAAVRAEGAGLAPDFAARSPAHAFGLPARHDGAAYEFTEFEGAFFDVDEALALIPAREPEPAPERRPKTETYAHRLLRAERYLERMPGGISGSGGHRATFKAAVALVRGFQLEPGDALELLVRVHNPLCQPEWSRRELEHKIRQAHQRARLPFGAIADRGRAA